MKMLMIAILCLATHSAIAAGGAYTEKYKNEPANTKLAVRPGLPKLSQPEPMAKIDGTDVQLKWETLEGANSYNVQVSVDPGFFNLKVDEYVNGATELAVKGLESGKTYYWRVAGKNTENLPGYTQGNFTRSSFTTK